MKRFRNRLRRMALGLPLLAGLGVTAARAAPACDAVAADVPPAGVVVEVIDGDTVRLDSGTEVRLVGMQAPKLALGRPDMADWPFSHEAKAALAALTLDREVRLWSGGRDLDRYGRRLAQLYVADDAGEGFVWVQRDMVGRGFARVYSFPDNRACIAELLAAERMARDAGAGLWALDAYRILSADDLTALRGAVGSYELVEGRVFQVAQVRDRAFLNFSADWNRDFTITIPRAGLRVFRREGVNIQRYENRLIRARGWMRSWNGPLVDVTHPEQIEVLD